MVHDLSGPVLLKWIDLAECRAEVIGNGYVQGKCFCSVIVCHYANPLRLSFLFQLQGLIRVILRIVRDEDSDRGP